MGELEIRSDFRAVYKDLRDKKATGFEFIASNRRKLQRRLLAEVQRDGNFEMNSQKMREALEIIASHSKERGRFAWPCCSKWPISPLCDESC